MKQHTRLRFQLLLIVAVALVLGVLAWPREDVVLQQLGVEPPAEGLHIRRGLDLQGGAYLVYEADMSNIAPDRQQQALENVATVLRRRADPAGTTEVAVQTASNQRVVVQYPGVGDVEAAKERFGRTAQLVFLEIPPASGEENVLPQTTGITGADVERASVDFSQTGQPIVALQMKGGESTEQFAQLTTRLNREGGRLVVLLDQQVVFGPAPVSSPITNGQASLTGTGDIEEAEEIATLLNAGALPVPVQLVAERTIGPTLGTLTLKQSLVAAVIGLASVSLFLLIYYRLYGVLALLALAIYTVTTVTLYKLSDLSPFPVVLTLAGIAGFILSIAVATDGSILILERIKEEVRAKSSVRNAMEQGYRRAWTSIRDANVATIIGTVILYQFGTPIIRGFAVTLGLGIVLNLLIITVVSRPLLRWSSRTDIMARRPWLFGLPLPRRQRHEAA